jgi:prevent-host-death family protein
MTSVREFRARLAEFLEGREPLVITRHGEHVAVVYPMNDPKRIPPEVRRRIYVDLASRMASRLGTEDLMRPDPTSDAVVEAFKRDVDRTLIRENFRKTPEQRLRALESLQRFAEEARQARPRRRK